MKALTSIGISSGIAGALLCLVGVLFRLQGSYWLGGFQVGTLLQAGTAAMVFGCFCLLVTISLARLR
jgi:hypothetical protein